MINLNGWQRLYIFLMVLFGGVLFGASNTFNSKFVPPEDLPIESLQISSYLNRLFCTAKTPTDCKDNITKPFAELWENTSEFKLSNGEVTSQDKRYTQEEVEKAYQLALADAKLKYRSDISNGLFEDIKIFVVTGILVYLFGWGIGWIRKGFQKTSI